MDVFLYAIVLIQLCLVPYYSADGIVFKNRKYVGEYNGDVGTDDNGRITAPLQGESPGNPSVSMAYAAPPCPARCSCTLAEGTITEVDCGHCKLDAIPPDIPHTTVKLILCYNKLNKLPRHVFMNLTRLEHLDLSHNIITHLQDDSLTGLSNIMFLSLDFNKLETNDSYSEHVFLPLRNIKELHIQGNCNADRRTCDYPKSAIRYISSLETLYQDGYPGRNLPIEYSFLVNLCVFVISGQNIPGYCSITHLSRQTLRSIEHSKLTTLEIYSCHVDTIEPFTFVKFKNLTTLILTSNQKLCGTGVKNLTAGLNSTTIKKLVLKDTCNTYPGPMHTDVMQYLLKTKLEYLDISNSHIKYIHPINILKMPTTLKYLSLGWNDITDVRFLLFVPLMTSLECLDGSFQSNFGKVDLKAQSDNCHIDRTFTRTLAVNDKRGQITGSFVKSMFDELAIDKSHVDMMRDATNISHPIWPTVISLPRNLITIYASHLKLESSIPAVKFNSENVLEKVDVSFNSFTGIQGKITGLRTLKHLNLSHNGIMTIHKDSFGDMENLRELDLRSNKLGQALVHHLIGRSFLVNQTKLEKLDMSSNGIKELPNDIFVTLKTLKYLNLRDNSLSGLHFRLDGITELQFLDVSFNQITYLSAASMNLLERIATGSVFQMDIQNNTLECTCDHQRFMKWLTSNSVDIFNRSHVTCQTSNSSSITLPQLESRYDQLQLECYTWLLLAGCTACFMSLTLFVSFVVALYNQRWKLRYLYYIGRHNVNPYHPIEEDVVKFDYEFYFSYDDSFQLPSNRSVYDYITTSLHPKLTKRNIRIIWRHELPTGQESMSNLISSAIRHTDKVVVMLASKYCKDVWNIFEFNIAVNEGIHTKRNVVIPVLMETVDGGSMTPEICIYCQNQKMIMFNEQCVDEFVDILENSIRHQ